MPAEVIRTIAHGEHTYELVRMNKSYMLFHQSPRGTAKMALVPEVLRDLGSAMLVEGASNAFRGG